MVVVYNKHRRSFRVYADKKQARESEGISAKDLLSALDEVYESEKFIIGRGEYIKSNRGGKR